MRDQTLQDVRADAERRGYEVIAYDHPSPSLRIEHPERHYVWLIDAWPQWERMLALRTFSGDPVDDAG